MMVSKITRNYIPEIGLRLKNWSKPNMVTINLTARCNQQCVYCEIGKEPSPIGNDKLDVEDLKWILDQMAVHKIRKIALCGGEPFLFKGILDVVYYARQKNITCYITSNGMTIHKLNPDELEILKNCKSVVNISVDSFEENILSFTRGNSKALLNALKSIEVLQKHNIPLTVLSVITKHNYKDLYNVLTAAHDKGICQVLFQPVIYYSNFPDQPGLENKEQLNVPVEELSVLLDELNKIWLYEKRHRISTNVYRILPWIEYYIKTAYAEDRQWFFNSILENFFCREIHAIIDISYDGDIQPCGLARGKVSIFENRELGLVELWRRATEKIKEDLKVGHYYDICNGCCHHFSRNMYASILKHPFRNRKALAQVTPLIFDRIWWKFIGKINANHK